MTTRDKDALIAELAQLLKESRELGLNFDIGNAYIRRAYIDAQDALCEKIRVSLEKVETAINH